MIAPPVVAAVPLEPYVVRVVFADGQSRDVDIEPLLDGRVFCVLRDPEEFRKVEVDEVSGGVAWPSGADLDPDVIYGIEPASGTPSARISAPRVA